MRILIEALSRNIAVEEAAADALFALGHDSLARGATFEAKAMRALSRMHRVKALGLRGQIAVLRETSTRHFRNRA